MSRPMFPRPASLAILVASLTLVAACTQVKQTLEDVDAGIHDAVARLRGDVNTNNARTDTESATGRAGDGPLSETEQAARLMDGDGVTRDPEAAVALLRPQAEAGDADAQFLLGLAYASGQGVEQNKTTAAAWYERAAEQGHAQSQYLLGLAYLRGDGLPEDANEASRWFLEGAKNGNAGAQYHLALGYAGSDEPEEAIKWFEAAAGKGHAEAQYLTGEFYHLGRGVPRNPAWAARWFGKAAAQGVPQAQYMLGLDYAAPSGVPRDLERAYLWLLLAAKNGDERAAKYRDGLAPQTPPEALDRAKKTAAAWRPADGDAPSPLGDRPTIVFVQYSLAEAGFDPGPIDGLMGPRTRRAIEEYAAARGLGSTRRISDALLQSLKDEWQTPT